MTSERFAQSGMTIPEYLALLEARADGLAVRLSEAETLLKLFAWPETGVNPDSEKWIDAVIAARAFLATSEVAK